VIDLGDPVPRMGEKIRERTVVGQEEESLGIPIQATHRK
jgi:hypothetical protein